MSNGVDVSYEASGAARAVVTADIARITPIPEVAGVAAVTSLLLALARHDGRTYMHSLRVGCRAWQLMIALGGTAEQARQSGLAGLLHDVGKINVPRSVVQKSGSLTTEEWAMIRFHPAESARLVRLYPEIAPLAPIIAAQYERPDGLGYPAGRHLADILDAALVLAVADAVEAMASRRPYAEPMSAEEIREELRAGAGTCWGYAAAMMAAQECTHPVEQRRAHWTVQPLLEPRIAVAG